MTEKKKKGVIFYLISAMVIIAVICGGMFFLKTLFVNVCGKYMYRTEKTVDLGNMGVTDISSIFQLQSPEFINLEGNPITSEQYDAIIKEYPDCTILWDIPLSSGVFSNLTEALSPNSLSESDLALLPYFLDLSYIDLSSAGINDSMFERVKTVVPECTVIWETEVYGKRYPLDINEIELSGKDLSSDVLRGVIDSFELLNVVKITDCTFDISEQKSLLKDYPDISFIWDVELLGKRVPNDVTELTFSGLSADEIEELKEAGVLLNDVRVINFGNEKWAVDSIASLSECFDGAEVICAFDFLGRKISTTETELDFSGKKNIDISAFDKITYVMHDLSKVIMCDCGIDDETMDGLNHKYDGVRFVWTVYVTRYYPLRTDRTYFCGSDRPNAGYVAVSLTDEEIQPLKYCIDLVALDLGHMHFTNIDFVKDMKQLRYLVISCGNVNDISMISECESLYYLEMFYNKINDISPILKCRNLRYLNIGSCTGFDRSPVFEMDFLEYLWYCHNRFSEEEIKRLQEALPNTVCYLKNKDANPVWGGWHELQAYRDMRDLLHMF